MLWLLIGLIAGFIGGYFVFKNNPKYLDIKNMTDLSKEKLQELIEKLKSELEKK